MLDVVDVVVVVADVDVVVIGAVHVVFVELDVVVAVAAAVGSTLCSRCLLSSTLTWWGLPKSTLWLRWLTSSSWQSTRLSWRSLCTTF